MKESVHGDQSKYIKQLNQFTTEEFNAISQWMIGSATRSVRDRLEIMYMNEGWHIVTARGMHCEKPNCCI